MRDIECVQCGRSAIIFFTMNLFYSFNYAIHMYMNNQDKPKKKHTHLIENGEFQMNE